MDSHGKYKKQTIVDFIHHCKEEAVHTKIVAEGKIKKIVGLIIEASGCHMSIGSRCLLETGEGFTIEAEVVGFTNEVTYLMPVHTMQGLLPNSKVRPLNKEASFGVGESFLGRVIDGLGNPLDEGYDIPIDDYQPINGLPINPLSRRIINKPLDVGIKVINSLLTIGEGQRIGLFAGSGLGKSVLMGMMTKFTEADVVIVALIGERGREVSEFIKNTLGAEGMHKSIVVAVPADTMPLQRVNGAKLATTIAEYFRDKGQKVLLLMDSLTRFAQAQREISLAIGEPPATKGYPPSVFSALPKLVERAGCASGEGSITAIYTVLAEGDDQMDPIVDAARAILDGHIVLSREMSESGVFPAINIEASISRVMNNIVDKTTLQLCTKFRELLHRYNKHKDVINLGIYKAGSDPSIDEAIEKYPYLINFIRQDMNQAFSTSNSRKLLQDIFVTAEKL